MAKQKQRKHATPLRLNGHAGKKALPAPATKSSVAAAANGDEEKRKPKSKRPLRDKPTARNDADPEQVAGVPDEGQIGQALGRLEPADRRAWQRLRKLLAQHLGSAAAARLWLVTPSPGFEATPLDEVRKGRAKLLLAMLESQWGPSPTYA
jgi:hypothetical protein